MKNSFFIFSIFIIFIPVFCTTTLSAKERPMIIAFYGDYAPYSMVINGEIHGILKDILTEALKKRMGLSIRFAEGPWERMQKYVKRGEMDALCTVPTEARKKYAIPSKTVTIVGDLRIYTARNNPYIERLKQIKTIEDLRKGALANEYRVGSYIGSGWIKENFTQYNIYVDLAPKQIQTIKKLALNRIDVFVNNSTVQRYNLKMMNMNDKIMELPSVLDQDHFYLLISKKSSYLKYLNEYDIVIHDMMKDGTIHTIIKKYEYLEE